MILKCAIIDDEPLAISLLESYVNKTPFLELAGKYNSAVNALPALSKEPVDLLFLDIQMPELNGMEFSRILKTDTRIIFTTAFSQYALDSYKVNALDYLLKPIALTSLERALGKLRLFSPEERLAHIRRTNDTIQGRHVIKSLLIMLTDKFYPLQVEDILYFYTMNEKVTAYTSDGKLHPVDRTLDALGDQLDEKHFFVPTASSLSPGKPLRILTSGSAAACRSTSHCLFRNVSLSVKRKPRYSRNGY